MKLDCVDISLSLGQLFWKKQLNIVIALFILSLVFPILTIIMLICAIVWNYQIIIFISSIDCLSLLLMIYFLCLIIKDKSNKKKVNVWLKDAVMLNASSKVIETKKIFFLWNGLKVKISFSFNNRVIRIVNHKHIVTLKQYVNRKINILYSPKYDEVLILKDNFNQITSF